MAVPPLNTSIGLDVEFPTGLEPFLIVHLVSNGSRQIRYLSSTTGASWARGGRSRSYIVDRGLPAVTWAANSVVPSYRLRLGQYLPYPLNGEALPSQPEPVNATEFFLFVRENLSQFAQDIFEGFHHQHSLFNSQLHHFDEDTPIDATALGRNREFLEAMRMKIGIHWRQLHEIPKIDPANHDLTTVWKALVETVRGLHNRLCATCGVRAWPSRVLNEMPIGVAKRTIDSGYQWYFDPSTTPWSVLRETNVPRVGLLDQMLGFDDYKMARAFYYHGLQPDVFPNVVSHTSNLYTRQRAAIAKFHNLINLARFNNGARIWPDNRTDHRIYRAIAKFCYLNVLACLRLDYNDNETALAKIEQNALATLTDFLDIDAFEAVLRENEHWTRRGFIVWDGSTFSRDIVSSSEVNDEGANNIPGDNRRGTVTVIVPDTEVYNLNEATLGYLRDWLEEERWVVLIEIDLDQDVA